MGVRREGREAAVQFLYLRDINNGEGDLESYYRFRGLSPSGRSFCGSLITGALEHQEKIDEEIRKNTQNYDISRISAVDRNILRIAIYELLHGPALPPAVSINEAIEIAKKYSAEESGRFVNGVLDQIRKTSKAPARETT